MLVVGAVAGLMILACAGGSDVPEPWSRREGEREVVVGDNGPGVSRTDRVDAPPAPAQPTTSTRVTEAAPDHLPPVERSYPEVARTGRISACPDGTTHVVDDRRGESFCVLNDTDTRHGPYVRLWGNGKVHETGPYKGGQRHGEWSEYHRSGALAGTWEWTQGQPGGRVDQ